MSIRIAFISFSYSAVLFYSVQNCDKNVSGNEINMDLDNTTKANIILFNIVNLGVLKFVSEAPICISCIKGAWRPKLDPKSTPTFLPPANEVWCKVMFLNLCVILFTGGGGLPDPPVGIPGGWKDPLRCRRL